ncbi:hypothetical protein M569_00481, partial [Genlisea aurea]
MSPQTETKASVGFKAGVKEYKLTYYTPEYETKDTDILAAFRVTPQPGVPPEEAGAAVAAESSTGTWTTVWTDGLTSLDRYKGRCYNIEPVPGETDQYICYVAYPLDLFEEGSVTNMFTSIVGNVFGFKALPVYECLRGGLDFTKDDENVNSQPFMRWRDRFLFCAEGIYKAQAETGEIKGHYLNATAGTCEEMIKRAVFARELGVPIIMHDYLTGGFTANTSLAHYCRDNGLLLHIHRAMHAVIDRQKNHGIHFRVLAKALRMSGGDHIHSGTVVGKLEGERDITLGFVDLLRDDFIEKDRSRGIYFAQDWVSLPGVIPVASGGIHVWHMPALTEIFQDDSVLQFGGGTLGHPWGNAPGAVANRVALEACVQARNEGRDLAAEGNAIIREASKWSPELAAACEVWKEIKFEFKAFAQFYCRDHITSCIDNYLQYQNSIDTSSGSGSSTCYISSFVFDKRRTSHDSGGSVIRPRLKSIDLTLRERSNDLDETKKYRHLWVQCENCYGLNYKKFLKSKMNICEQCGYHLKMSSSERLEVSIDHGTWEPMDEDMVSMDPIGFHSEEEPYKDRMDSYQRKTGLTEAVQTGIGRLNVSASGGARMQEGSLSLMQMAKISSSLYDYQSTKKLFYVAILTSPTTGGVTASFGMLGDIIIAEPNSYIAFAGKRVIEQTLNKTVPEGSQAAEYLFQKGLFDLIVPRNLLKSVLSELFKIHAFFPLN